ncbi:flexible cuticle protein 12-like [Bicyclus anynana]|uniref:Flexible cuticle protein 12-like n=1 Tax=Bicyclus anynana TaxID=110368 RepID=A0A6J1P1Q5_BICAN|nr:flexible cuticle protein 12-like [Bicyclus anynana]
MKLFLVNLCLIAVASAAPSDSSEKLAGIRALPALFHEEVHDDLGQYTLKYKTAEGIFVSESGRLVPSEDGSRQVLITEGEVSYVGDDGKTYVTKYSAGVEGTKMEGDHLPKPVHASP